MNPATQQFDLDRQSEVFFSTRQTTDAVSRHAAQGRVRKLGPRLYTANLADSEEAIVRRNVWRIAAGYFPGGVIVDRTALEMQPAAEDGSIFLAAQSTREVRLPGIRLRPRHGAGPLDGDLKWMGEDLFMASRPRAYLENMRASRARGGPSRTLSRAELEESLHSYARLDPGALNALRDQARAVAENLGAEKELAQLGQLLSSLLGTGDGEMQTPIGRAWQRQLPYDTHRVELFETLHQALLRQSLPRLAESPNAGIATFAFFEAYFSNYIEGTEFTLEEAEEIVFEGRIPAQRPDDAHDILGTYRLVSDQRQRRRIPSSVEQLIEILKAQHFVMLEKRPEIKPGEFKQRPNRAGGTQFVEPHLVAGTLAEGYRFYSTLNGGLPRAVFAHFLVSEVHPFADGNGRMARILMNSELTAAGEQRIIVPTVERYQYLNALRAMSHNARPEPLVKVTIALQKSISGVDFSAREVAERQLREANAFADPSEAGGVVGAIEVAARQSPS